MSNAFPAHRCRTCGATSYRHVIARDEQGVLRASDLYQCSGCSVVFADPKAWREGGTDEARPTATAPTPTLRPVTMTKADELASAPKGPDWASYGLTLGVPHPGNEGSAG